MQRRNIVLATTGQEVSQDMPGDDAQRDMEKEGDPQYEMAETLQKTALELAIMR